MVIPYASELDAEERGWYEIADLVRRCHPEEHLVTGYYHDPDWSLRDLVGHLGTWLAEAATQFDRMLAGTYEGHDVDIDALNATFLEALHDQPWEVCWSQANAARTRLRQSWTQHARTDRRSRMVDPQVRRRPLRRAQGSAGRVGRGAGGASRVLTGQARQS